MDAPDVLLTPAEAAAESGFSVMTIRDAYKKGDLRAFQPRKNGHVRIPLGASRVAQPIGGSGMSTEGVSA